MEKYSDPTQSGPTLALADEIWDLGLKRMKSSLQLIN